MGIAERREREKEKRRESIIDAAEKVFFSSGFENATMLDVAKKAELSKGALYLYFQSKNELCMAILNRSLKILVSQMKNLLRNSELTGLEKIGNLGKLFINFSQSQKDHYKALLSYREHKEHCPDNGRIFQNCKKTNKEINSLIAAMLHSGVEDGSIRQDIDQEKISIIIWGNFSGFLPSSILTEENLKIAPAEVMNYFFELVKIAIAKEKE